MKNLFFELIQISLYKRESLSKIPSMEDWHRLFNLGEKHTVIGICFCGLQKIPIDQLIYLPKQLKIRWIALTMQIQHNNEKSSQRCLELQHNLNNDGYRSVILKGQGVASLYPLEIRQFRQSGDIDVWVDALESK